MLFDTTPKELFSRHLEFAEVRLVPSDTLNALDDLFTEYSDRLFDYLQDGNEQCKQFYLSEARGFYVDCFSGENHTLEMGNLYFGSSRHIKPLTSSDHSEIALILTKPVRHYLKKLGWEVGICVKNNKYVIYSVEDI